MLAAIALSSHWGYLALFALVALESTGIPLPGETALIGAGVLAARGQLDIALVIGVAAAAAIIGDNVGYLIGRTGGRRLLERPGFLQAHRREILTRGEPFIAKHGPKAVFLGRWVALLRIATAWLAGIERMPWPKFLVWNALGGVAWATSIGLLAYFIGPTIERVVKDVGYASIGVLVVAAVAYYVWRRRRAVSKGTADS